MYSVTLAEPLGSTPLTDKKIIFLGSSVTFGSGAGGVSFVDYIEKRCGCKASKHAVSGTTLVDNGITSYISRMKLIKDKSADLFVCQLSTNDATKGLPLGEVSESENAQDFDTSTVAGAIEYIIAYAKEKWHCPVAFYTNPQYDSKNYAAMVELLGRISEKWGITVIDLWNNKQFNNITEEQRKLWMKDSIHPTKAGYLEWWVPVIEQELFEMV